MLNGLTEAETSETASVKGLTNPQPKDMVLVPLSLIQRAQQAINWHLEPNSPAEHNTTMLELSAIGWPGSVPATQAPAPAPDGYKLVPIEPTAEMIAAWPNNRHGSGHEAEIYRAMLAAAPATQAPAVPHGKEQS